MLHAVSMELSLLLKCCARHPAGVAHASRLPIATKRLRDGILFGSGVPESSKSRPDCHTYHQISETHSERQLERHGLRRHLREAIVPDKRDHSLGEIPVWAVIPSDRTVLLRDTSKQQQPHSQTNKNSQHRNRSHMCSTKPDIINGRLSLYTHCEDLAVLNNALCHRLPIDISSPALEVRTVPTINMSKTYEAQAQAQADCSCPTSARCPSFPAGTPTYSEKWGK